MTKLVKNSKKWPKRTRLVKNCQSTGRARRMKSRGPKGLHSSQKLGPGGPLDFYQIHISCIQSSSSSSSQVLCGSLAVGAHHLLVAAGQQLLWPTKPNQPIFLSASSLLSPGIVVTKKAQPASFVIIISLQIGYAKITNKAGGEAKSGVIQKYVKIAILGGEQAWTPTFYLLAPLWKLTGSLTFIEPFHCHVGSFNISSSQ